MTCQNGKIIQDIFKSSLNGSSNKFSYLSFTLKLNTYSTLKWKFSYVPQIPNQKMKARVEDCYNM